MIRLAISAAIGLAATATASPLQSAVVAAFEGDRELKVIEQDLDRLLAEATGDALAGARLRAGEELAARGEFESARDQLRAADLAARAPEFKSTARFNLGQVLYREALTALTPEGAAPPDLEAVQRLLRDAAEAFRAVLEVAPGDAEAARNVERVRRLASRVDQARQEAQEKADQLREQAEKLDELADRQQDEANENAGLDQMPERARQDQNQISEQTQQAQQQSAQNPEPNEQAQQAMESAAEAQRQAQRQLNRGDQEAAADAQQQAAEQLRRAAEALREQADRQEGKPQGQPEPQPGDEQQPEQPEPSEEESQSPDDRIAEWLFDREQRQREERDRQIRAIMGRPVPVEKDW